MQNVLREGEWEGLVFGSVLKALEGRGGWKGVGDGGQGRQARSHSRTPDEAPARQGPLSHTLQPQAPPRLRQLG